MILGRDRHPASACFDELNAAVEALLPAGAATVCFNAHVFPDRLPAGAIVYNLENVGIQVSAEAFPGHEVWDFSRRNVDAWREAGRVASEVRHVPVAFHPSMQRFEMRPWEERTIDVVFAGALNARRSQLIDDLRARRLNVAHIPHGVYGAQRDAVLARSKLALNPLFYERGMFPSLRACHAIANHLPVLSERAPEMPEWCLLASPYEEIVGAAA